MTKEYMLKVSIGNTILKSRECKGIMSSYKQTNHKGNEQFCLRYLSQLGMPKSLPLALPHIDGK